MRDYYRFKTEELIALIDITFDKLKEMENQSITMRKELAAMVTELTNRGIEKVLE